MIKKLLDVYNDLMLNVPKVLIKFLPANSDSDSSSSGEDNDDVITVEPSRLALFVGTVANHVLAFRQARLSALR